MSLINSATADCRIIEEGRSVTYAKNRVQQSYVKVTGNIEQRIDFVWEYRRFCTADYKYVGLSYDAAITKQNALLTYYKRDVKISDWDKDIGEFFRIDGGKTLMNTQIQVVKTVGHMYELHVSINEEDCIMRTTGEQDATVLFAEENLRQYEI